MIFLKALFFVMSYSKQGRLKISGSKFFTAFSVINIQNSIGETKKIQTSFRR